MLFLKQGEYSDYSGRKYSYVEYKIRVLINRFGTYRTYSVWNIIEKNNWYIMDSCVELLEDEYKPMNNYLFYDIKE